MSRRVFVFALAAAFTLLAGALLLAAEQTIDLDQDPSNGDESRVVTRVLQAFPVEVENVVHNEATGKSFTFLWPGAGPGGFDSRLFDGPEVGTKWEWTTVSQVYAIQSLMRFNPQARGIPVFGQPMGGVQSSGPPLEFTVPGRTILPSQATASAASLTSSLVTFFSPEQTIATCESRFFPGRFENILTNYSGVPLTWLVNQNDCCRKPEMTICPDGCKSYLTDRNNCGDCGIDCPSDEYCWQGACKFCREPKTVCGDACVDMRWDERNCGECGNWCGPGGACVEGVCCESLHSCPAAGSSSLPESIRSPSNDTGLRARPSGRLAEDTATGAIGRSVDVGAMEAPVCELPPIEMTIADGESYTQCQTGARIGKEVFTSAVVQIDGKTVGQGPCAQIVPAPELSADGFVPVPVMMTILDASGDGMPQPGEFVQAYVGIQNLGATAATQVVATISSAPDMFNPLDVDFISANSGFADIPSVPTGGDCENVVVPETFTNQMVFSFQIPEDHESDVGRAFNVNFQGEGLGGGVDMPLIVGIGSACEHKEELDGETYDRLIGLLSPVNAHLRPAGSPVNYSSHSFDNESPILLKFKLGCGGVILGEENIDPLPQIVGLEHETLGTVPLTGINAGADPDDPFFVCGAANCQLSLLTTDLAEGDWIASIRMPDSRVFRAGFTIW